MSGTRSTSRTMRPISRSMRRWYLTTSISNARWSPRCARATSSASAWASLMPRPVAPPAPPRTTHCAGRASRGRRRPRTTRANARCRPGAPSAAASRNPGRSRPSRPVDAIGALVQAPLLPVPGQRRRVRTQAAPAQAPAMPIATSPDPAATIGHGDSSQPAPRPADWRQRGRPMWSGRPAKRLGLGTRRSPPVRAAWAGVRRAGRPACRWCRRSRSCS